MIAYALRRPPKRVPENFFHTMRQALRDFFPQMVLETEVRPSAMGLDSFWGRAPECPVRLYLVNRDLCGEHGEYVREEWKTMEKKMREEAVIYLFYPGIETDFAVSLASGEVLRDLLEQGVRMCFFRYALLVARDHEAIGFEEEVFSLKDDPSADEGSQASGLSREAGHLLPAYDFYSQARLTQDELETFIDLGLEVCTRRHRSQRGPGR